MKSQLQKTPTSIFPRQQQGSVFFSWLPPHMLNSLATLAPTGLGAAEHSGEAKVAQLIQQRGRDMSQRWTCILNPEVGSVWLRHAPTE